MSPRPQIRNQNLVHFHERKIKISFPLRKSPTCAHTALLLRFVHHTQLEKHTRYDSFKRAINSSQRQLPAQNITNAREENPCPRRDSNSQSQQSTGYIPTPQTTRSPRSKEVYQLSYVIKHNVRIQWKECIFMLKSIRKK